MDKVDFKKTLKSLYAPSSKDFSMIDVPAMNFFMVDGEGNPNTTPTYAKAVESLYSTSYALKFASKIELGRDYVVPPLEGLWHADDPSAFVRRAKDEWYWTMMIMYPDWITQDLIDAAIAKAASKLDSMAPIRTEEFTEGLSVQIMHIGSYDDEGPTLARLHSEFMPQNNFTFNGKHHEIYIGDPRKTDPSRLKTVLRQPVTQIA